MINASSFALEWLLPSGRGAFDGYRLRARTTTCQVHPSNISERSFLNHPSIYSPDPTYYNVSGDISETAKGGVIARSRPIGDASVTPAPDRYCVSFHWLNQRSVERAQGEQENGRFADDFGAVVLAEQRCNNETKIETGAWWMAGVFSRRNFYSVLSVHVYRYLLCCHGPGYCVLGARAGIIPDTSDGDV